MSIYFDIKKLEKNWLNEKNNIIIIIILVKIIDLT